MEMPHLFADVRFLGDTNAMLLPSLQSLKWGQSECLTLYDSFWKAACDWLFNEAESAVRFAL